MITPTMAITEMTARTMSNIFMDLFMGYGMQRNEKNPQPKPSPELRNDSFVKLYYAICLLFFPTSHQNQNKQTASATIIRPCSHSERPALVAPMMPAISTTW